MTDAQPILTGGEAMTRFFDDAEALPLRPVAEAEFDSWRANLTEAQAAWIESTGFKAKAGKVALLPGAAGALAGAAFGLGDGAHGPAPDFAFGALPYALPEGNWRLECDGLPERWVEEAALGWLLGAYRFTKYCEVKRPPARLIAPEGVDAARLDRIAAAVAFGRDLINTPAEEMGPDALQSAFEALAEAYGATASATLETETLKREFPMLDAVGRAGARPPRMLDMVWGDPEAPKLTLVGKGICFDTGGLDIKPGGAMALMKKDMGGAATAMALARMVMDARLPVRLRLLVPAAENNIAADAFRPGDVFRARNGMAIEIDNTDAEGRLVLADALTLAGEESPELTIDFATLTGAARVALGAELPPFFTDDDALAQSIHDWGQRMRDPVWRLPLWESYDADLASSVADLCNSGSSRFAGAITAALFLKKFAKGTKSWVHFDVYGWAPKARGGVPKGGEIQSARALYALLEARYNRV